MEADAFGRDGAIQCKGNGGGSLHGSIVSERNAEALFTTPHPLPAWRGRHPCTINSYRCYNTNSVR